MDQPYVTDSRPVVALPLLVVGLAGVRTAIAGVAALLLAWLVFVVFLALARPDTGTIKNALRLLPDTVRLLRRLATDKDLPRSTRLPVWLLIGYLAIPIDLVPDFIPVLGYADDVILVAVVLRRLARRAGHDKLAQHWPGDPDGLRALISMLRLPPSP